jgi:hypothetical protein
LLVVPTHRAFCVDIPPAVMIEPVVADVASVVRVELMPAAAVTRPTSWLVVPTHRAFCADIPPAVIIDPVVADVASVVRVELTPPAAVRRPLRAVVPVTARALVPSVAPPSAKDVPVAAPSAGVVSVGLALNTRLDEVVPVVPVAAFR